MPAGLTSRLSVKADALPAVLRRLGFRSIPAMALPKGVLGPPAPPMMALIRRKRPAHAVSRAVAPVREGPFAALATLRQ
jgi:hypothetical protein